jgi:hypothetical protein
MAFPNLTLLPGASLFASAQGIPVNGRNTFLHGLDPAQIDEDWLLVAVDELGPSVTDVTYVGLSADRLSLVMDFVQAGVDECWILVGLLHSEMR